MIKIEAAAAGTRNLGMKTAKPITILIILAPLLIQSGSGWGVSGLPDPEAHKN